MTNHNEIWQVNVNGQIYETNFAGLAEWINEGSLLPNDKVRRGHLPWVEAGKISLLYGFFNAKELGIAPPVVPTINPPPIEQTLPQSTENVVVSTNVPQPKVETAKLETSEQNHQAKTPNYLPNPDSDVCAIHADRQAVYVCGCCAYTYCKACPHTYSSVKICPFCGEMCHLLEVVATKEQRVRQVEHGFGFMEFANALGYPFKFPASLVFGAVMFMFFTIGQSVTSVGGIYLLVASIFCAMLANTLTFGILANSVESMAKGKMILDFMPRFDEFSLWDDVVHPFFLSIGVYVVSFGLFIALIIGMVWYSWSSISSSLEQPAISTLMPAAQDDLNSAKQIPQIKQLSEQLNKNNQWKDGQIPDANQIANSQTTTASDQEAESQRLPEMINQSHQAQMESVVGKLPTNEQSTYQQMAATLLQTSGLFIIPIFSALLWWLLHFPGLFIILIFLAFLWGLFYFPVACAVAGYTHSFTSVINPAIGLDTIKHLGFDYVKILLMFLGLAIITFVVSLILGIIFSLFDLPQMGNLPAIAVGSFFHFYFWIVFSIILGLALRKNSARLNLFQVSNQWSVVSNSKKI